MSDTKELEKLKKDLEAAKRYDVGYQKVEFRGSMEDEYGDKRLFDFQLIPVGYNFDINNKTDPNIQYYIQVVGRDQVDHDYVNLGKYIDKINEFNNYFGIPADTYFFEKRTFGFTPLDI